MADQFIGGNFWAKPDGTGFSQTATDGDGDGIADAAYNLPGNNYSDFLPLVGGFEPKQSVMPPVNFNTPSTGTTSIATSTNETKMTANETAVNNTEMGNDSEIKTDIDEMEDDLEFD